METLSDEFASQRQLAIVERFEAVVNYLYPIAISINRSHHVVRDRLIDSLFEQANLFSQAGKSTQVSKLYLADSQASQSEISSVSQKKDCKVSSR